MSFVFEVGKLVFDLEGFIDDLEIYDLAKYNYIKFDHYCVCMKNWSVNFQRQCV